MSLMDYLNIKKKIIDNYLNILLPYSTSEPVIYEAMRYSLFCGGKRIRPILCLMVCDMLGGNEDEFLPFACSIEMIHTYSLIHDDLPGMDNDDFRRGNPSNHKVYGEGYAILAGDALLNKAFEIMMTTITNTPESRFIHATKEICTASGLNGMIGGQAIDLYYENKHISADMLDRMHEQKTGALICASLNSGSLIANATYEDFKIISNFGKLIGKAFQITDDILDITSTTEKLGKPVGSDKEKQKSTYVSFYGLEESKVLANKLIDDAKTLISPFPNNQKFIELADYIINREK